MDFYMWSSQFQLLGAGPVLTDAQQVTEKSDIVCKDQRVGSILSIVVWRDRATLHYKRQLHLIFNPG